MSVYTVKVIPKDDDNNGIMEINPQIMKNGSSVSEITFDNKKCRKRFTSL